MKPTLNLYAKWKCSEVLIGDEPWKWAIVLSDEKKRTATIINKSRRETIAPIEIVDGILMTVSMSLKDTSLHFQMPNGHRQVVGMMPTQYAILDPLYGGQAYPQWPEELEEAGIPSHPEEDVSAKPTDPDLWASERERLASEQEKRHVREANDFIQEDQ